MLLEEEMRRAIQFCAWKVNWWDKQAHLQDSVPPHLAEGIAAYATEQAGTECHRITSWSHSWFAIRQQAKLVLEMHLKDQEDMVDVAVLEVEIEGDDDDDKPLFNPDDE